jgi:hypothetical protein
MMYGLTRTIRVKSRLALRVGLVLLFVSCAGDRNLYAGSTTFTATGGAGLYIFTEQDEASAAYTSVPAPSSITVTIAYDPDIYPDGISTSGFTTTYCDPSSIALSISGTGSPNWPGFSSNLITTLVVTAPPAGQGPDSLTIDGFVPGGPGFVASYGDVQILAPNGTLSSSLQLPVTLDAFTRGGSFDFSAAELISQADPYSVYFGFTSGSLNATPEPATIVLMSVGVGIVVSGAMLRRRKRARLHR